MNRWGATASFIALVMLVAPAFATSLNVSAVTNQTLLSSALQYAECKANVTVEFIGQITSTVPKLSSLSVYVSGIQSDETALSSLASSGNVTSFRAYLSGTFDPELNGAAKNISVQLRDANLSANTTAQLRASYNADISTYQNCSSNKAERFAANKVAFFNESISNYQQEANKLASNGVDTSALNSLLQNATIQIVTPLVTALGQAHNASQIYADLAEYCLFDGCKNGTNFHLAAHFGYLKLTAEVTYLESDKNVSNSTLVNAQADLNNASTILAAVGTKAYVGGQGKEIFSNLTAAAKAMRQPVQQDAFAKLKGQAQNVISKYKQVIGGYQAKVAASSTICNKSSLNQTLSQANMQIIVPLQNALNSSKNASQLYNAFKSYCLADNCPNGTNFHLGTTLQLEQAQAYFACLSARANASKYVIVNQTELSLVKGYLSNASASMNASGHGQFGPGEMNRLSIDLKGFMVSLKGSFMVNRTRAGLVNRISVMPRVPPPPLGGGQIKPVVTPSGNSSVTASSGLNVNASGGRLITGGIR